MFHVQIKNPFAHLTHRQKRLQRFVAMAEIEASQALIAQRYLKFRLLEQTGRVAFWLFCLYIFCCFSQDPLGLSPFRVSQSWSTNQSLGMHGWIWLLNIFQNAAGHFQQCLVCLHHGFAMRLHDAWCLGKCPFCSLACISGTLGGDVAQAQTRTVWKEQYKGMMLGRLPYSTPCLFDACTSSIFIMHCFSMLRCATRSSAPRLWKKSLNRMNRQMSINGTI